MLIPVLTSLVMPLALARDDAWRDLHERVRAGELVGLSSVLDWLDAHYRGEVVEVELEYEDDEPIYEVEMLGAEGQLVEFEFDARSGELIAIEGVDVEAMKR
ncbi:PepSY domain-containing protein [Pistricoccus aurantiacus]|nr:PepSY domain-containing protein [Pistricoccus aurantiacus]